MAAAALGLAAGTACAESGLEMAMNLGTVIGSEEPCGLSYNIGAIERFVAANIPDDDMTFMDSMNASVWAAGEDMQGYSEAQKAAHCAQIRRIALRNGFIE